MSLLEVNDLRVRFHGTAPDHYAVDGVSFFMEQGDILGLVGESGTGKTVTAMCISGLLPREKAYRSGNKNPYRRYSASEGEEDSNYTASFKPGTGAHGAAPEKKDNNENTGDKKDD